MFGPTPSRGIPGISGLCAIAIVLTLAATAIAQRAEPKRVEIFSPLPYGPAPINYFSETAEDLIKELQTRLRQGQVAIASRPHSGYLLDLLRALDIPVESQLLVFSKTSVNQALIKPKKPRAIYFNDDVTVGWVPDAAAIEITVQDPLKGTVFYTLAQPVPASETTDPATLRFHRDGRCTACHVSARTLNVPGHIVSSFLTDAGGQPREGYSSINHASDYGKRWGGWYVTGTGPKLIHWGNLIGDEDNSLHKQDPAFRGIVEDLAPLVDLTGYPARHSDVVAQLVLNHQMHFYNLVNRVNFESRLDRRSDAEEQLVRYALMQDEAPLAGPITGSTTFAELYQRADPVAGESSDDDSVRADSVGMLRKLDLQTGLYQQRLSPLIASRSVRSLPDDVKSRLFDRIDTELAKRPDQIGRRIFQSVRAEFMR